MSKKNFTKGLNTLLGEKKSQVEAAAPENTEKKTMSILGKTSVTIAPHLLEKIRALAYWERLAIKNVMNTALENHINKYEKESGKLKPIPQSK